MNTAVGQSKVRSHRDSSCTESGEIKEVSRATDMTHETDIVKTPVLDRESGRQEKGRRRLVESASVVFNRRIPNLSG